MADAHAKHHDYHLVDPSPWPFLGSIGALVMAFGGVALMEYLKGGSFPIFGHNIANPWLFFIGLFSSSEFGTEQLDTKRAYELCVPALRLP